MGGFLWKKKSASHLEFFFFFFFFHRLVPSDKEAYYLPEFFCWYLVHSLNITHGGGVSIGPLLRWQHEGTFRPFFSAEENFKALNQIVSIFVMSYLRFLKYVGISVTSKLG